MRNGFYILQEQYKGDTSGFLDALDNIDAELPICIDDSGDPAQVSVGSFLQGFCGELAKYFEREYGLPIGIRRILPGRPRHYGRLQAVYGAV